MCRSSFMMLVGLMVVILSGASIAGAQAADDSCAQGGVYIANLTDLDLWIKRDGGACTLWRHFGFNIPIRPGERIEIFSDLDCRTTPCEAPLTYETCRPVDGNGDCMIKINQPCKLLDV